MRASLLSAIQCCDLDSHLCHSVNGDPSRGWMLKQSYNINALTSRLCNSMIWYWFSFWCLYVDSALQQKHLRWNVQLYSCVGSLHYQITSGYEIGSLRWACLCRPWVNVSIPCTTSMSRKIHFAIFLKMYSTEKFVILLIWRNGMARHENESFCFKLGVP